MTLHTVRVCLLFATAVNIVGACGEDASGSESGSQSGGEVAGATAPGRDRAEIEEKAAQHPKPGLA